MLQDMPTWIRTTHVHRKWIRKLPSTSHNFRQYEIKLIVMVDLSKKT